MIRSNTRILSAISKQCPPLSEYRYPWKITWNRLCIVLRVPAKKKSPPFIVVSFLTNFWGQKATTKNSSHKSNGTERGKAYGSLIGSRERKDTFPSLSRNDFDTLLDPRTIGEKSYTKLTLWEHEILLLNGYRKCIWFYRRPTEP